ncbi:DUF3379 domain-containing protein [Vibrio sp. JC009]|uniref:DUF3379 domain-containing protein n=1 Tax=Vibrio sp. JC009 TaxID=2912314 RepID=UPI0023B17097|nr:DUF3379 domain-containing protein [Vibrio sp. JC009]WED21026.1 DUF3379 domain-containing protein [Vibrio sp. JC009]
MDDLKFRRHILSEPKYRDEQITQAIEESEINQRFAEDVLSLDAQIEEAFKVDVPDDLADKILFSQTTRPRPASFSQRALAMAASVAFIAGILLGQINWGPLLAPPAYASLADTAMEHVVHESPFTDKLDEEVSSKQINAKLAPFSYQFTETFPYHVYYLNHCGFGQSNALHMVFQGEKGRVTLFVTNISSDKGVDFNKDGMSGVVIPVENSSMILVGSEGENISQIAGVLKPMIKAN